MKEGGATLGTSDENSDSENRLALVSYRFSLALEIHNATIPSSVHYFDGLSAHLSKSSSQVCSARVSGSTEPIRACCGERNKFECGGSKL